MIDAMQVLASPSSSGLSVRTLATIGAVWLVIACIFAAQQTLGSGEPVWPALARVFIYDGLWAGVTVALLSLVRRQQSGGDRLPLAMFATHGLLGVAAALFVTASYWGISHAAGIGDRLGLGKLIAANLLIAFIIYWTILGAILLVEGRRHAAQRREATAALERSLAGARTAMLRAQLRPHFLFNTLNSIAGLITEDPPRAEAMVVRLGDLLRLALDERRGAHVTLNEELAAVDLYLAIEQLRLADRLRIQRDIAPDALRVPLPDLLLQPLVENAIRHGIAPLPQGGVLRIEAARDGEKLRIVVADDGLGTDRSEMEIGIGLRSIMERVAAAGGTVEIVTSPGAGFRATIYLPADGA